MKIFYTYLWLREDGTPYYVGKGQGKRAFRKNGPKNPECILLQEYPTEEDAFAAEIFLISYYGRKDLSEGCLRNLTNGGDGVKGFKLSEKSRKRMSEAAKGKKNALGHSVSEELRNRISQTHKGKPWSLARREAGHHRHSVKPARMCSVEGCVEKHVSKGKCQHHYDVQRWKERM